MVGKDITIKRSVKKELGAVVSRQQQQQKAIVPSMGGIALASAEMENDPFKAELLKNGYTILVEKEFGVIAKKATGKPSFKPRTSKGYFEKDSKVSLMLPESVNTAMKIRTAGNFVNYSEYLVQLVMKDLKENNLI